MCYRDEQSLDFRGIHLACLAGDNGHGKSALLDAITWALWGKARAPRDDDLITLGRDVTDMWVDFEFGLGGQSYRVWRQRSKKGRGQSDLHFYVWNPTAEHSPENGEWRLLDEGGLRERQALISRTLRMEYETFINSAFLLQGHADSFTVKTAGERKQILADILGLSRYDAYEERAKQEAQARKEQASRIQGEIVTIDGELSRRGEYEARLQAARTAAAHAVAALRSAEAEQAKARSAVQERQSQVKQLVDLRGRLARGERDLADLRGQLDAAKTRLGQFEAVLAQREQIEAGWAELQQARADDAAWHARLLRHTQLAESVNRARLAVDQARLALEAEGRRLADHRVELGRKITAGEEQRKTLAEAQAILARMAEQQTRRDAITVELRLAGERIASLKTENERLKAEGQATNDKAEILRAADPGAAACPLCGQPLDAGQRDQMLVELAHERDNLAGRYRVNQTELRALDKRRAGLEAEDADLARELRARDARQRQAAQAEAAIADAQAAAEEQARVAQQIADLSARLADRDYAPAEQVELARQQAELAAIGYDAGAHEAVRVKVNRLEPFDGRYQRQLLPALDGIADARGRVDVLAGQFARREAELADDRAEAGRLTAAVADLPRLEAALARADAEVERTAGAERRARLEEGAAQQQISALAALAERRKTRLAELDKVNEEISVYNQLREAFGKKGLQAMIIESAIPEIEVEANRLLSRMTEGRMSLRLETQREKVTGGMAETLDIIIADELGSRPWEMFSGGESFRANLALRIAISKLLARHAGAQLQTLVIDEGFGSQDSQGRQLVVEAINSIQHDFERIIVITHIEELKDLFPARIDVVKTASGSRVSIA
jgi:exonuclease SbcC